MGEEENDEDAEEPLREKAEFKMEERGVWGVEGIPRAVLGPQLTDG